MRLLITLLFFCSSCFQAKAQNVAAFIPNLIYVTAEDSTPVDTSHEQCFDQEFSIPANTLQEGSIIKIFANVDSLHTNPNANVNYRLRLIGQETNVVVAETLPTVVTSASDGILNAVITIRKDGSPGELYSGGWTSIGAPIATMHFRGPSNNQIWTDEEIEICTQVNFQPHSGLLDSNISKAVLRQFIVEIYQ